LARTFQSAVYKITFPNRKIHVGKDIGESGHTIRYFVRWDIGKVEQGFSKEELTDFTIRREILFENNDRSAPRRKK
jgi:hypothetical protein